MTAKEKVLDIVSKMPDESTLDDIGYEIYVIESVEEGLAELDRGDYFTHEEAGVELGRWLQSGRMLLVDRAQFGNNPSTKALDQGSQRIR